MALTHVSSQLQGIGEMSVMTLVAISDLDSKLVAIGNHFHALEVREETWSSLRDRLIELNDTLEDIEQQFDSFPIYSMYCLEILEELAEDNGIAKENFRTMEDKKIVNTFRRRVSSDNRKFTNNLSGLGLSDEYAYFCSLLEDYRITSRRLDGNRNGHSELIERQKKEGIPEPEKIHIDYLENLGKKIAKFEEIEALLPAKRKELEDEIIQKRHESEYYRKLVSSDIKVDMNSAHPLAKWYRENEPKIMADYHQEGWYPHQNGVKEICGHYETRAKDEATGTPLIFGAWETPRGVEYRKRCKRTAIEGQPYCITHRLNRPAYQSSFMGDPDPTIVEGETSRERIARVERITTRTNSMHGHGWEMKSFTDIILKEQSHWNEIRKPLDELDSEILNPKSSKLIRRRELFITNKKPMEILNNNIESDSRKLQDIENELSEHLPLDVNASDL